MNCSGLDGLSPFSGQRWLDGCVLLLALCPSLALSAAVVEESESVESDGVVVSRTQLPTPDNSSTRSAQSQAPLPVQRYPAYPVQSVTATPGAEYPPDPDIVQPKQNQSLRQYLDQAVGEAARTVASGVAKEIVRSLTQGASDPASSGSRSSSSDGLYGVQPTYQNGRRPKGDRF